MHTSEEARKKVAERGPRFAVTGNIRQGEVYWQYADTAEKADALRDHMQDVDGYYQVTVYPPQEFSDTVQLIHGLVRERDQAKTALDDVTGRLRAVMVRLVNQGALSESEAARRANVDRMTIRNWLGKR
jgi:hypothetical protein